MQDFSQGGGGVDDVGHTDREDLEAFILSKKGGKYRKQEGGGGRRVPHFLVTSSIIFYL